MTGQGAIPVFVPETRDAEIAALNWEYYQALEAMVRHAQYDAVIASLNQRRVEVDRAEIPFFLLEARCYSAKRDLDKAIEILLANAGSGKSDYWAHYNLGAYFRENNDIENAVTHYQMAHACAGWPESRENGYRFTHDYFSPCIPTWTTWFEEHVTDSPISCLEIGSWQGGAATWLLDKIVSRRGGSLVCIDTFEGSSEHAAFIGTLGHSLEYFFDTNIRLTGHGKLCRKLKGYSQQMLPTLYGQKFDFIYVDGAHEAKYVIQDAILSWLLLPVGGHLAFDDIDFRFPNSPAQDTARATEFFESVFSDEIEIIERGRQLLLKRIG
jgi:predicted O-methyltransferase YrrM